MRTHRYQITISGGIREIGREAFGELLVESHGTDTILIGDLDQAALLGALNRILALGLELIELSRLTGQANGDGG